MNFSSICDDKVCLLKINGEKYENVLAHVQDKLILLPDTSVPIDEGDQFIRSLPNGRQETYEVINPRYYGDSIGGTEPHYQIDVKKVLKSNKEFKGQDSGHKINITGNNSPVTINSNGNYINVDISGINDENVFEELRKCISKYVNEEDKEKLLSSVDNLEKTKGTSEYTKAYKTFMQVAKDCVAIVSPFIPYLSDYLK